MFLKFVKGFDIYGHQVGVHYRGDSSFKTGVGAFLTFLSFILISLNTLDLFVSFITKIDQKESVRTLRESLHNVDPQNLRENNFDIILATSVELDPKIARWSAAKEDYAIVRD